MKNPNALRLGVGSSFADDRISPAVELAEKGDIDYLIFECLAERTIARENQTKLKNPEKGYTPRLLERMQAVMPVCIKKIFVSSPTWAQPILFMLHATQGD